MTGEEKLIRDRTKDIIGTYGSEQAKLISILQEVQAEFGYLPREAIVEIAKSMAIAEIIVYGVATFYNQFRLIPPGRHPVKICLGTACHIKGGEKILEAWERELGIKVGQVAEDREFSLERVACIGCCAMAPVSVVDEAVQGKVTPTKVKGILLSFQLQKEKAEPESSPRAN